LEKSIIDDWIIEVTWFFIIDSQKKNIAELHAIHSEKVFKKT